MTASISLTTYIAEWLTTFKETTVKQSTYDRLLTSVKALEAYTIASMPIGDITCIDIQQGGLFLCGICLNNPFRLCHIVA